MYNKQGLGFDWKGIICSFCYGHPCRAMSQTLAAGAGKHGTRRGNGYASPSMPASCKICKKQARITCDMQQSSRTADEPIKNMR